MVQADTREKNGDKREFQHVAGRMFLLLFFLFTLLEAGPVMAQSSFDLKSGIFNIAGGRASSLNYNIHGTLGQAGGVSSGMNFKLTTGIITAIKFEESIGLSALPESFELSQNYPNPFNPTTVINYALPTQSDLKLTIYNLRGEQVAILIDGTVPAGNHRVSWDASNVSSGIYFYRLRAGNFVQTRKMLLLK